LLAVTDIDLAAIKARAEAATTGPWRARSGAEVVNGGTIGRRVAHGFSVVAHGFNRNADADYIARVDPPTTLALVAEVERLTFENERLRKLCEEAASMLDKAATMQALVVMDTTEDKERCQRHVEVLNFAARAIRTVISKSQLSQI
jgi:hypothetical protein